ncbi:MAG: antibiotic biosynthesis monooxygenase [Chloroflexota bacterium]|nr:MAG: antibiotic biosynthesis monooxygenase [Chloroflexota bacterium]
MIRGIIGYQVSNYKDVESIFKQLRSHAMEYAGFVSAENLVSEEDQSVIVMVTTWQTIENWRAWEESKKTKDLLRQLQEAKAVVIGAARLTAYRTLPTIEWS